jgi:hypothetical protein
MHFHLVLFLLAIHMMCSSNWLQNQILNTETATADHLSEQYNRGRVHIYLYWTVVSNQNRVAMLMRNVCWANQHMKRNFKRLIAVVGWYCCHWMGGIYWLRKENAIHWEWRNVRIWKSNMTISHLTQYREPVSGRLQVSLIEADTKPIGFFLGHRDL